MQHTRSLQYDSNLGIVDKNKLLICWVGDEFVINHEYPKQCLGEHCGLRVHFLCLLHTQLTMSLDIQGTLLKATTCT